MAFTQLLAVGNRSGSSKTVTRSVPDGFVSIAVRLDLPRTGVPNPFTDPVMQITIMVEVSYDGGSTWHHFVGGTVHGGATMRNGSPNLIFFKEIPPSPDPYPTHTRGDYTVTNGPVSMGLSMELL